MFSAPCQIAKYLVFAYSQKVVFPIQAHKLLLIFSLGQTKKISHIFPFP